MTPYYVRGIHDMIGDSNTRVMRMGLDSFRAVPAPYPLSALERIGAAYEVLMGRAHAVKWPEPGDLERALNE